MLPRPLVLCIGRIIARLAFYLVSRERKKALNNLRKAYGATKSEKEIRLIGRTVFENMALTASDFVLFPRFDRKTIDQLLSENQLHKIGTVAERKKQGGIIITAHMGNWELLAATAVAHGYDGFVLGKRLRYDGYNDSVVNLRKSQNVHTYYRDQSPRELLQQLKKGILVGILPDQDIADIEGIFVDFFGMPAYTPTGPAKLAITAKVPIIVAFMLRDGAKYRLIVERVIDTTVHPDESKQAAVERLTVEWSLLVEKYIKKYPDQWAWFHNRWKTQKV
jgi:KDO2-lipid IV(A) lauroyltransferase